MRKLVILNGVSSSGKSTIAKMIQSISSEPFALLAKDDFMHMRSMKFDFDKTVPNIVKSMMYSIAAFLYNDNDVIVDTIFSDLININNPDPLTNLSLLTESLDFFNIKDEVKIILIKIFADEEILIEREILRNDRRIGLGISQIPIIHKSIEYDIKIDTSFTSPLKNARKILEYIESASAKICV